MQQPATPRQTQEKDIDEMDQSMPDQHPSPLTNPYEDPEEHAKEEEPIHVRKTLKDKLQDILAHEADPSIQADLQWELHVVELTEQRFPHIKQLYEAHCQIELPLTMIKIEQEKNMAIHMPLC